MKNPTGGGRATGQETEVGLTTSKTTTRMKDGTGNMNIYRQLEEIEVLRQRVKQNQDQVLDVYDPQNDMMRKLLIEMNSLLEEADQVENEMEQLMKQL
jgi:predicted  nucleic acid-binding Zn-ribbon protein